MTCRSYLNGLVVFPTFFNLSLNQIPYDYIVEVTNRFKELDLIECLKNYGRKFMDIQTPYDYMVEVTNRFKRLDLIECLKNYGQRFLTLYRRQGSRPSLRKRNAKKQNGCLRRPHK